MKEITPLALKNLLTQGEDISMIDVRETDELVKGKISGVKHIPLGEIPARLMEIDKSKKHILVCRSGSRSAIATQFLESIGYDVENLAGGMLQWEEDIKK